MVMDKILLLNVHSSMNVGDEALLHSALEQFRMAFPGSQITLSMNDAASYTGAETALPSLYSWVHPVGPQEESGWKLRRLVWLLPASLIPVLSKRWFKRPIFWLTPTALRPILRAYLETDLAVGIPGGYLFSSGRGLSLLLVMVSIYLALLAEKPVYLLPQSIGPMRHGWEKWLLRRLLERVRMVMVREPVSLELVEACRVRNPQVKLMPDVAFGLPGAASEDADAWLREQGIDPEDEQPCLGITIVNWGAQNKTFTRQVVYEQACAAAARWFVAHTGGRVIFFPQVWGPTADQDDRIPARRVADGLQDIKESIHLVQEPLAMRLLKAVYGKMDIFIGTRMHSNIFALSEAVPVIAIGYQHKTRGIAAMVGMSDWVIDIQQVDENVLIERLEALWKNRQAVGEQLRKVMPEFIRQSQQAGMMVLLDITRMRQEERPDPLCNDIKSEFKPAAISSGGVRIVGSGQRGRTATYPGHDG
jgi:colanic acid/amylovoran biosynthesis protein